MMPWPAGDLRGRGAPATARLLVSAAALLLGWGLPAAAQTVGTGDDFRSRARLRTGPLYLTPSLRLDKLGVETNVFNTTAEKSDFVAAFTPRLETWLPFQRRALLAVAVAGGVEYYKTFAGERSFNPEATARIEVPLRRVTVAVGGNYRNTRERPLNEIDLRARRVLGTVDAAVGVEVAPRLSVVLQGAQERTEFDGDAFFEGTYLSETLNREVQSGRIAARWRRTVLSTFYVAGEYRDVRFLESPDRDSGNVIITAGGEFHPRALISGSGEIGVRRFAARGSAVHDLTRVVARADLSYRFQERTTLTFETERDISYSFLRDDPFYVLNRQSVAVARRLGASFDLTGRLVRDVYDYQSETGRRHVLWGVSGTLGYYLSPTDRVGLRVRYVTRDSATDRWRYDGLEAGLIFDYGL